MLQRLRSFFALCLLIFPLLATLPPPVVGADSTSFDPTIVTVKARGTIAVGTIMQWIAAQDPADQWAWLECDGRSFSTTSNPDLAKIYPSGKVPDLRNQFLRGGERAQVGNTANDSLRSHYHAQPPHTHTFDGRLVSGAISGSASKQSYTDMWTDIGHGGYSLKEGDLSELGHQVRDSTNRYTSGGSISGNVINTTVAGTLSTSGGDNTYQNSNSDGTIGGAETAPKHIRVRFFIRALP